MSNFTAKPTQADGSSPEVSDAPVSDLTVMNEELSNYVTACQRGERDAQRELFERFHQKVFRLAIRMVGQNDAADLVQQVFLHAFQTIGQFTGRSRFDTWLYRVAVNECLQHIRREKPKSHQPLKHEPADREIERTEQFEQQELINTALGRLEPDLRAIFLLREFEGQNYAEIAESLDVPEGTVASRLNRSRRQLKEILIDLGWEL